MLEQTRTRIVELEKNIADLQKLLNAGKSQSQLSSNTKAEAASKTWAPAALALGIIALTGLLLWFMARHARQSERTASPHHATRTPAPAHSKASDASSQDMPEHAKSLFAGINLDLTPNQNDNVARNKALRVKLNLAKAYLAIEDFSAAQRCLNDVIERSLDPSHPVDVAMVAEAKTLLVQISQRNI
jgi:pilus assembly protein FimV